MSKGAGTTLTNQKVAASTRHEKVITEWNIAATKVTRLAAEKMNDRSRLSPLAFSLQRSMEKRTGLNFWPSLFAKQLCQLAEP